MGTTVQLDDDLSERLQRLTPGQGLDSLVNQAVAEKVAALESRRVAREQITREMREGYIATAAERDELAKDWEVVDLEGWPEYRPKPQSIGIGASGYADTARRTSEERPAPRSWR